MRKALFLFISFLIGSTHSFSMTATNGNHILQRITPQDVSMEIKHPVDPQALEQATAIINELRNEQGTVTDESLLQVAKRLGDIPADASSCIVSKEDCRAAFDNLSEHDRTALSNIYNRVKAFATMQRNSVKDMEMDIPGGKAGHTVSACRAAGCYAPGGRYPLPSSVIMTAVTARAAGCETVVLASPRPAPITLAAAHLAGADLVLCVGGAQAIAAMAYGSETIPRCDVICGPGNKWVTAAKSIVNGHCGIDMLAGPSEVLVICDDTANPTVVAADLIAQAEHDVVARAILLCTSQEIIDQVDQEVAKQLESLPEPNKSTAAEALKQSFAVHCDSIEECIKISDDIAPEHLEIQTRDAMKVGQSCMNYGGLFVGEHAAEVLGDYGAGPNHTLPTGGTGRYTGGLSVFNFLRIRTWMRIDDKKESQSMVDDSIIMARLEGLEGHARAAETRSLTKTPAFKQPKV
ncbi:histidinol dehydrogenase [Fistulifera solaris]|uniref:Histidinol dehydrogenase n=1 Tax=Fistulifera solaris TaxID=1519565 RepID=A0A1Z5KF42_FISSO|nr:histidinol dehydrogenase [Fistulifera solaris]|eukprot:GAX24837.1 histidinol dehydrogenase [Fistulifera solaris]